MNSNLQVQDDQRAGLRARLERWAMILVVIPACWLFLWTVNIGVAVFVWSGVSVAYLSVLFILTFTTMFVEQRYADRLKLWRTVLAISGRIAFTGIIAFLYLILFVWTQYGPDYFQ